MSHNYESKPMNQAHWVFRLDSSKFFGQLKTVPRLRANLLSNLLNKRLLNLLNGNFIWQTTCLNQLIWTNWFEQLERNAMWKKLHWTPAMCDQLENEIPKLIKKECRPTAKPLLLCEVQNFWPKTVPESNWKHLKRRTGKHRLPNFGF